MRKHLCNLFSVLYSFLRFSILKLFHPKGLRFHLIERFSPNVVVELEGKSTLNLGKNIRVHSGSKIKVRKKAILSIGNNVRINYNCIIVSRKEIVIGNGTEFGPNVFLYDHDHDYKSGLKNGKFLSESTIIGDDCWIGANTVILRGTTLGNNCIVGAGSVLKGHYEDNSIIIQKRTETVK